MCECMKFYAINYTINIGEKYIGIAAVSAANPNKAIEVLLRDGSFNGYRDKLKITSIEEIPPSIVDSLDLENYVRNNAVEVLRLNDIIVANGKSAYEIAVMEGFKGTVDEWLASLKGDPGESVYDMFIEAGLFEGSREEFIQAYKKALDDAISAGNFAKEQGDAAKKAADAVNQTNIDINKAEELRVAQEQKRQEDFATAIKNSEDATNNANTAAKDVRDTVVKIEQNDVRQDSDIEGLKKKDINLQEQVDALVSRSDVVDVVACYNYDNVVPKPASDIVHYDTSKITINDVIKVLKDESQDNAITYYRLINTNPVEWTLVGSIGEVYTRSEVDNKFATIETVNGIDSKVKANTEKNTTQDSRLNAVEAKANANESKNIEQDERLSAIENNIEIFSYGVLVDNSSTDPHLVRTGNPVLHKTLPVQSLLRGCIVKDNVLQYYLDANNWNLKEDGTPSKLDGTDGNKCVETPKFYFKAFELDENKTDVRISLIKIDDSWIEIPRLFVDANRCTISGGKAWSVNNKTPEFRGGGNRADRDQFIETDPSNSDLNKPRTNISRATMRGYAKAANAELMCYEFYKYIFCWLYWIEYASFYDQDTFKKELTVEGYHQGGLGTGVTNVSDWGGFNGYYPVTPNGYCDDLGNGTGIKELKLNGSHGTLQVPRWRGFDNPFGDIWTNLDGVVLKRDAANQPSRVMTTTNPINFDDSESNKELAGMEVPSDGWTKTLVLGKKGEIIPASVGANETTGLTTYHWCNASYTGARTLLVGGTASNGAGCGFGYFYSYNTVGYANTYVGFRCIRRPKK